MRTTATSTRPPKIRVLCVDDCEDIPMMLGRCIAAEPDMESVGCLNSADNLRAEVERTRADVVLLDMRMPGFEPMTALNELLGDRRGGNGGAGQSVRVIAYSGNDDAASVNSAATAGARGFLSKDAEVADVLDAIREVARGDRPFRVWRATRR